MKRLILLLFLLNFGSLIAQKYEDVGWMSKFGAAIGYTPSWMIPNVDPLNNQLKAVGLSPVADNGLFVSGGGGYIYVMLVKDLRIGGMGFTGSSSSKLNKGGYISESVYNTSGGGLSIEYTLPFVRRVGISVGAIIGSGTIEIDLYKNKDNFSWDDVWVDYKDHDKNSDAFSRKLKSKFYTFTPTINFDIPFTRFSAIRIGGGYQISFDNDWKIENERTLKGVPDDLNGDSFYIQAGIFVGFFAF